MSLSKAFYSLAGIRSTEIYVKWWSTTSFLKFSYWTWLMCEGIGVQKHLTAQSLNNNLPSQRISHIQYISNLGPGGGVKLDFYVFNLKKKRLKGNVKHYIPAAESFRKYFLNTKISCFTVWSSMLHDTWHHLMSTVCIYNASLIMSERLVIYSCGHATDSLPGHSGGTCCNEANHFMIEDASAFPHLQHIWTMGMTSELMKTSDLSNVKIAIMHQTLFSLHCPHANCV